ncbi:hypothetical protein Pfo_009944 [Paulownia fortunei]|nr:hypothetical protein Pfo_009944 [Paulownia fortunei]
MYLRGKAQQEQKPISQFFNLSVLILYVSVCLRIIDFHLLFSLSSSNSLSFFITRTYSSLAVVALPLLLVDPPQSPDLYRQVSVCRYLDQRQLATGFALLSNNVRKQPALMVMVCIVAILQNLNAMRLSKFWILMKNKRKGCLVP